MRYYEKSGEKFIENGKSLIRVGLLGLQPSPLQGGRTVKVVEVVQVLQSNPANEVKRGMLFAFSFPNEKVHAKEYTWYANGVWEECMLPYTISDKAVARLGGKGPKVVHREVKPLKGGL